jgi:integrase
MSRLFKPPAYRRRLIRGKPVAYLQIRDALTGRRRDYWLGPYGSPESRQVYARLVAEWESHHRHLPPQLEPADTGITVDEMIDRHWDAVGTGYGTSEQYSIRSAADVLSELYGHTPAAAFGPLALRAVQAAMVAGRPGDPTANPPIPARKPWRRKVVNSQLVRVRAIFRWAESFELVPVGTCHGLSTVPALRAGRTTAAESKPVRPVPEADVLSVLPLLSDQVADMVRLMLLTGMRPGEVCAMTRAALDATDPAVWVYRPAHHKTAHHGHTRQVFLGSQARAIIEKYLPARAPDAPLFSPTEAEVARRKLAHQNRKTPLSCGNRPGTNRVPQPRRKPGNEYDTSTIGRAIRRAIDQYNAKAKAEKRPVIGYWHPHQLRHLYATEIRRQFGLEAAQIMLGHSSAIVTDAVYAERDERASRQIAEKIG